MIDLEAADQGAQHPFRNLQWNGLRQAMVQITYHGDLFVVIEVLAIAMALLCLWNRARQALVLGVVVVAAIGLTYLTKYVVDRPRPNVAWSPLEMPASASFPSGHTLMATALYGTLGILLGRNLPPGIRRRLVRYLCILIPFLVGASRMYVGHNYMSDVLAGWVGGLALVLIGGWLDEPATSAAAVSLGGTSR